MKKIFAALIIIISIANIAIGQNCYVQLADMSGFDTSPYQSQLEDAACELIQEFPSNIQNQFKVFDFGFYSLNETMQGGFQAVWDKVVQDAASQSPYYLLFGKQSDRTGIYTKFWLDLKLPADGKFSCFESDFYNKIEFKVLQKVNTNYASNGNSPYSYSNAEIEGIEELKNWITEIVNCCDPELRYKSNVCSLCSWTTDEALEYFSLNGFEQDSVSITSPLPTIDSLCICSTDYNIISSQSSGSNYEVEKHTTIDEFSLSQTSIGISDLLNELEELASLYGSSGYSFYGAITDNNILCSANETVALKRSVNSPSYEDIESKFNTNQIGVWIHVQYDNSVAFLNVKTKGFGGNVIQNCNDYPQYCDELSFTINRLESTSNSFYNELVQQYCSQSSLDLEIRIADTGGEDSGGTTSALKKVIKEKVVVIKLNEDKFDNSKFCDSESLGYLYIAKTLLHEGVHAILKRLSYSASGKTSDEKKRNFGSFNYGYTYAYYRNNGQPEHLASFYTEHYILLKFFFRKITKTLLRYNNQFGQEQDYFWMTYNFGWTPVITVSDLKTFTGYNSPNTISEIESLMESNHENLKSNPNLPCQD